ncbi:MAG: gliding motility-associated C-terminal domain-containing protein, partial [Bacteroidia bacterium]|nr:gliding motility-associated C-terminal domain-containing protein [Bacteroidia bacterium]
TTYYKREVTSGACTVISSSTIKVTVLPLITNNIISTNQTVCYNTQPGILTGAIPSGGGGAGTYTFFWEQSTDGTIWTPANGINDSPSGNYQPPALTVPMKYKRTVTSGSNGCCINTSDVVDITIHPPLPTGTITSTTDTTICEGSKVRLQIHLTGASKWKVFYMENSTQITINEIAGTDTTLLVAPVTGTSFTTFNYSLFSVEDKNGCIATSLTGTRKADVYKIPTANAGRDTVVCGAKITLNATPGIGSGTWYYPAAIVASTANNPSVTVIMDSTFTGSSIAHKFIWEEINWQCRNKDSVIITFYKRVSSINAGPDTSLFSFDNIIRMVADPLLAWETGLWTLVSGTGDFDDNSNNLAEVMNLSKGINTFLWRVTNGECNLEDSVNINVYDLVIPEGFSPNNDPGNYNNTFIITGLDLPNQIAELTIVNGAGTEVFSTTNIDGLEWTDWDGKNSKGLDLPEGTYYYLLKITSNGNSQVFKKSGFIVLKRY